MAIVLLQRMLGDHDSFLHAISRMEVSDFIDKDFDMTYFFNNCFAWLPVVSIFYPTIQVVYKLDDTISFAFTAMEEL